MRWHDDERGVAPRRAGGRLNEGARKKRRGGDWKRNGVDGQRGVCVGVSLRIALSVAGCVAWQEKRLGQSQLGNTVHSTATTPTTSAMARGKCGEGPRILRHRRGGASRLAAVANGMHAAAFRPWVLAAASLRAAPAPAPAPQSTRYERRKQASRGRSFPCAQPLRLVAAPAPHRNGGTA